MDVNRRGPNAQSEEIHYGSVSVVRHTHKHTQSSWFYNQICHRESVGHSAALARWLKRTRIEQYVCNVRHKGGARIVCGFADKYKFGLVLASWLCVCDCECVYYCRGCGSGSTSEHRCLIDIYLCILCTLWSWWAEWCSAQVRSDQVRDHPETENSALCICFCCCL